MGKYPDLKWVRRSLRLGCPVFRRNIIDAYIVGSEAKGTAKSTSDLDIAVIIDPVKGKDSIKFSERYHQVQQDWCTPDWHGRKVDFQFFYPKDEELQKYQKIPLRQ